MSDFPAGENVRGSYFCPTHDRKADWDFLQAWEPAVIRLMVQGSHSDPNSVSVPMIQRVHDTCPEALIILRVWDVDDREFKAHDAMSNNPHAEAEKQVEWWARLIDRCAAIPRRQLMAGLNNETDPSRDNALIPYTSHALERGTMLGIRLGGLVFSTGRPSLPGEAEYDMDDFANLAPLFLAGDHAELLHEYMQPEGMYATWTDDKGNERKDYSYLIGRHKRWPAKMAKVKKIIAEWGIEGILYNRHPHPEHGNSGWGDFPALWSADRYADEYVACVQLADPSVQATCPFEIDFGDKKWASHDLIRAYAAFLARKHLCVRSAPDAVVVPPAPVPVIIINGPTVTSITEAGARIRAGAGVTAKVLGAVVFGTILTVTAKNLASTWYRVQSPFGEGWVSGTVVAAHNVEGVPVVEAIVEDAPAIPLAAGILDPQVLEAILQVESGGRAFGADGRPLIRFEAHVFRDKAADKARVDQFFSFDQVQPWTNQVRLQGFRWLPIHTGKQADEYDAFAQAQTLDIEAAHKAISMGAGQVMGFNHQRIGYASALTMFAAFGRSVNAQLIGVVNYMLSDPALVAAVKARNWEGVAAGYNGGGNIAEAAGKYRAAYDALKSGA